MLAQGGHCRHSWHGSHGVPCRKAACASRVVRTIVWNDAVFTVTTGVREAPGSL